MKSYLSIFLLASLLLLPQSLHSSPNPKFIQYQEPEFLTYDELVTLSKNPEPGGVIAGKIKNLFTTPIISNEAYYRGIEPRKLATRDLGPFIRVGQWNIEKSLSMDEAVILFTDEGKFKQLIDVEKYPPGSKEHQEILDQRARLAAADILILQEMDIGVKRSKYKNSVKELADALDMNYAYGTEQLEIDPMNLGMKEEFTYEDGSIDEKMYEHFRVDPEQYKGLFGSAVLSRYPIKRFQLFQLKHQGYDWYHKEKEKTAFLEGLRRVTASEVFLEKIQREMKIGGRVFFRVDLHVPELPGQTLTVINVHLEIKCPPKDRENQIYEILSYIHTIKNPVILAGDFNSANDDLSPTSVKREIRRAATDPSFWLSQAINVISPHGLIINVGRMFSNLTKNFQNPTARHIPLIAPNPSKGLFQAIKQFQFSDGNHFDWRGDEKRSVNGKSESLANSNERDFIGYKMTFKLDRTYFGVVGTFRLDWIFVKPVALRDPKDSSGSYRFAPHFGATLEELNFRLKQPISDHAPSVADLPFEEPRMGSSLET